MLLDDDDSDDELRVLGLDQLQRVFSSYLVSPSSLEQRLPPNARPEDEYADLRTLKKAVDRLYHPKLVRALDSNSFQYARLNLISWKDFLSLAAEANALSPAERSFVQDHSIALDAELPASLREKARSLAASSSSKPASNSAGEGSKRFADSEGNDFDDDFDDESIEEIHTSFRGPSASAPTTAAATTTTNNKNSNAFSFRSGEREASSESPLNSFDRDSTVDDLSISVIPQAAIAQTAGGRRMVEDSFVSIPELGTSAVFAESAKKTNSNSQNTQKMTNARQEDHYSSKTNNDWNRFAVDESSEMETSALDIDYHPPISVANERARASALATKQTFSQQRRDSESESESESDRSEYNEDESSFVSQEIEQLVDAPSRTDDPSLSFVQQRRNEREATTVNSSSVKQAKKEEIEREKEKERQRQAPQNYTDSEEDSRSSVEEQNESSVLSSVPPARPMRVSFAADNMPHDVPSQTLTQSAKRNTPRAVTTFSLTSLGSDGDTNSVVSSPDRVTRSLSLADRETEREEEKRDRPREREQEYIDFSLADYSRTDLSRLQTLDTSQSSMMQSISLDSPVKTRQAPPDNVNSHSAAPVYDTQGAPLSSSAPSGIASLASAAVSATPSFLRNALTKRPSFTRSSSAPPKQDNDGNGNQIDNNARSPFPVPNETSVSAPSSAPTPSMRQSSPSVLSKIKAAFAFAPRPEKNRDRDHENLHSTDSSAARPHREQESEHSADGSIQYDSASEERIESRLTRLDSNDWRKSLASSVGNRSSLSASGAAPTHTLAPTPSSAPSIPVVSSTRSVPNVASSLKSSASSAPTSVPIAPPASGMGLATDVLSSSRTGVPAPQRSERDVPSVSSSSQLAPALNPVELPPPHLNTQTNAPPLSQSQSRPHNPALSASNKALASSQRSLSASPVAPVPIQREMTTSMSLSLPPTAPTPPLSLAERERENWKELVRSAAPRLPRDGRGLAARLRHIQYHQQRENTDSSPDYGENSLANLQAWKRRVEGEKITSLSETEKKNEISSMRLQELLFRSQSLQESQRATLRAMSKTKDIEIAPPQVNTVRKTSLLDTVEANLQEISQRWRAGDDVESVGFLSKSLIGDWRRQSVEETVTVFDSHFPRTEKRVRLDASLSRSLTASVAISLDERCVDSFDILRERNEPVSLFLSDDTLAEFRSLALSAQNERKREQMVEKKRGALVENMLKKFQLLSVDDAQSHDITKNNNTKENKTSKSSLHDTAFYHLPAPSLGLSLARRVERETTLLTTLSEFDSSAASLFHGELLCKKKGIKNYRSRSFRIVHSPTENANLSSALVSVREEGKEMERDLVIKHSTLRDFYLVEYRSALSSAWGSLPIRFKRAYSLSRQLLAIVSDAKKGRTFTLFFLSTDDLSSCVKEDELRRVSNGISNTFHRDAQRQRILSLSQDLSDEEEESAESDLGSEKESGDEEAHERESQTSPEEITAVNNNNANNQVGNIVHTKVPKRTVGATARSVAPEIATLFEKRRTAAIERLCESICAHATLLQREIDLQRATISPSLFVESLSALLLIVDGEERMLSPLSVEHAMTLLGAQRSAHIDGLLRRGVRRFVIDDAALLQANSVRLRAPNPETRLQWVRVLQAISPKDVYINTVNF